MVSLQPRFREDQVAIVTSFIRHHFIESEARGIVLGMSGGVDSSLVAALCVRAVEAGEGVGVWGGGGAGEGAGYDDAGGWGKGPGVGLRALHIAPPVSPLPPPL